MFQNTLSPREGRMKGKYLRHDPLRISHQLAIGGKTGNISALGSKALSTRHAQSVDRAEILDPQAQHIFGALQQIIAIEIIKHLRGKISQEQQLKNTSV